MTARDEDAPRVLIFADILGFEQMTREIRVRVEDYPADEHGFTGQRNDGAAGPLRAVQQRARPPRLRGESKRRREGHAVFRLWVSRLQERAPSGTRRREPHARLHRARSAGAQGPWQRHVLRHGIRDERNGPSITRCEQVEFYGTAVIHAHAAEQCGGKGMRIFLHRSVEEDLAFVRHRLQPLRLRRPHNGVNYELDYLHEQGPIGERPPAEELDRDLFAKVALLKNPALPKKVLRQFSETFAALNRMRHVNSRKRVAAHRLPTNAPHGTIW
jgi:hypothetical protein